MARRAVDTGGTCGHCQLREHAPAVSRARVACRQSAPGRAGEHAIPPAECLPVWPCRTGDYAVVIGFDMDTEEIVLRSGTTGALTDSMAPSVECMF